jgi:phage I-like protein
MLESGWYDLARTGDWHHPAFGEFTWTVKSFETWVRNIVAGQNRLKIDYNHASVYGGVTAEEQKAAGHVEPRADNFRVVDWVNPMTGESDGSKVLQIRPSWTPEGRERINAQEYWGMSVVELSQFPSPHTGKNQGETLLNIALTSDPFIPGLKPLVAASRGQGAEGEDMDLKEIRNALGIGDDVDLKEHLIALTKTAKDGAEATETLASMTPVMETIAEKYEGDVDGAVKVLTKTAAATDGADDKDVVVLSKVDWQKSLDRLTALEATTAEQEDQLKKAALDALATERDAALDKAVLDGKITVAERDVAGKQYDASKALKDPSLWTDWLDRRPAVTAATRVGTTPGTIANPADEPEVMAKIRVAANKLVEDKQAKDEADGMRKVLTMDQSLRDEYNAWLGNPRVT